MYEVLTCTRCSFETILASADPKDTLVYFLDYCMVRTINFVHVHSQLMRLAKEQLWCVERTKSASFTIDHHTYQVFEG